MVFSYCLEYIQCIYVWLGVCIVQKDKFVSLWLLGSEVVLETAPQDQCVSACMEVSGLECLSSGLGLTLLQC